MSAQPERKSVVVVGAGNIGSHLIPHLGRMDEIGAVTIVDRDRYEERNISGQDITPADTNRPKAAVQARRLRRLRRDLVVHSICADLERLPPGLLHADVILAAVDNRRARRRVNEVAWQLRVPWIDAAVDAAGLLVRIAIYVPGDELPCLECGWNDQDYDAIDQVYPCPTSGQPGRHPAATAGTNAPSALGAVAAGMQALECRALVESVSPASAAGRQVFADLRHHQYYCTSLPRNPRCRRRPHSAWRTVAWDIDPRELRVGDLLHGGDPSLPGFATGSGTGELRANNQRWTRRFVCATCGASRSGITLLRRPLPEVSRRCPRCQGRMYALGLEVADSLREDTLSKRESEHSLHDLGLRTHDLVTVAWANGGVFHGRITGDRR